MWSIVPITFGKFNFKFSGALQANSTGSPYTRAKNFNKDSVLDMRMHFKPTKTFFTTYHPRGAKKGFVKSKALRLLRTNASNKTFEKKTLLHLKNTL